jgi:hypothetical protein
MAELQHKFVTTNGIRMHYVEQGAGVIDRGGIQLNLPPVN